MKSNGTEAVSPVVGVMLMLVVTIIIAAVVSGFAGGLAETSQYSPTATVGIDIKNSGDYTGSYFTVKVLSMSEPIHTKNLKLVTSWIAKDDSGATITGGGTSLGLSANATKGDLVYTSFIVPTGYGPGVNEWANSTYHPPGSEWGNYSLMAGTILSDSPSDDYSGYAYSDSTKSDALQEILGENWYYLRSGDAVDVRIVHVPSGKAIVNQQVIVEE